MAFAIHQHERATGVPVPPVLPLRPAPSLQLVTEHQAWWPASCGPDVVLKV